MEHRRTWRHQKIEQGNWSCYISSSHFFYRGIIRVIFFFFQRSRVSSEVVLSNRLGVVRWVKIPLAHFMVRSQFMLKCSTYKDAGRRKLSVVIALPSGTLVSLQLSWFQLMCCRVKSWNRCFIELRVIFISPRSYRLLLLLSLIIDGVWPGSYGEVVLTCCINAYNLKFDVQLQGTLYTYFVFIHAFLICVYDVPSAFLTLMNWGD